MKRFWFSVIVGAAGALLTPDTAQAQRYRGFGVNVGRGYSPYYGGYGYGGYGYGGYGGRYGYAPYYRDSYYWGGGYYPRSYGGYYGGGGWYDDDSYYGQPMYQSYPPPGSYAPPPTYPSQQGGYSQQQGYGQQQGNIAELMVRVPPNAELWVEGMKSSQKGPERIFQSPELTPGQKYTYTLRARWMDQDKEIEQTRTVPVQAGQRKMVDFMRQQDDIRRDDIRRDDIRRDDIRRDEPKTRTPRSKEPIPE